MSEAQAKDAETEDGTVIEAKAIEIVTEVETEIEVEAAGEVEEQPAAAVEIPIGDDDTPASKKKVPRTVRRLQKKSAQLHEATDEVGKERAGRIEAENQVSSLLAEKKLRELHDKQPVKAPVVDDFDTDQAFQEANDTYQAGVRKAEVRAEVNELLQQGAKQNDQAAKVTLSDQRINAHYDRADELNVTNYDELESSAISVLGQNFVTGIMQNTDNSELIIASLGANPVKAKQIAEILKHNAVEAFGKAAAFQINPHLLAASLKSTPDPETTVAPGGAPKENIWTKRLDEAIEKAQAGAPMSVVADVKKAAKAAGVIL